MDDPQINMRPGHPQLDLEQFEDRMPLPRLIRFLARPLVRRSIMVVGLLVWLGIMLLLYRMASIVLQAPPA